MSSRGGLKPWLSPGLIGLHLFTLAAVLFCAWMGSWQLDSYRDRQEQVQQEASEKPPVPLEEYWGPSQRFTDKENQLRVLANVEFLPADQQWWVEGKGGNGQKGYWLLAPTLSDDALLFVVRGWAPELGEFPAVPSGTVTVSGFLQPGDGPATTKEIDTETRTLGSVRIPLLFNEVAQPSSLPIWEGYLLSEDEEFAAGMVLPDRPKPEASWAKGGQNLGYTLQWWVFVAFALFMWWRIAKAMVERSSERD